MLIVQSIIGLAVKYYIAANRILDYFIKKYNILL